MVVKHLRMIKKQHEYFINYRYVGDVSPSTLAFSVISIMRRPRCPSRFPAKLALEPWRRLVRLTAVARLRRNARGSSRPGVTL